VVEPKYTTRQAVESKVGSVHGWEELLECTGFHFISQIKKDVPATIVFPEHDDSSLQRKCQKHIEALLGMSTHFTHPLFLALPPPVKVEGCPSFEPHSYWVKSSTSDVYPALLHDKGDCGS